jgi:hypothetical protein
MKNLKLDAEQAWKDFEDLLASQLNFSVTDRAVYSHLFRHSRLEGKLQFRFSITWLARGVGIASTTARDAVRRLVARGVLHLVERNTQAHHVVRLRLPSEVRAVRAAKIAADGPAPALRAAINLEEEDFLRTRPLRQSIHAREAAAASIVCARSHVRGGASTTLCRARNPAATFTATSCLAASIATGRRGNAPPKSFCDRSIASTA